MSDEDELREGRIAASASADQIIAAALSDLATRDAWVEMSLSVDVLRKMLIDRGVPRVQCVGLIVGAVASQLSD